VILPARVWSGRDGATPGRLEEVDLDVVAVEPRRLVLRSVTAHLVDGDVLFDGSDLRFDPRRGGGHAASAAHRREALAFGTVNTAYHLQRALDHVTRLLGRPLPPLVARIGAHAAQRPSWGGGHYRLPAARYSALPEEETPAADGEVHLGAGGRLLALDGRPYIHTASHDPAIVCHEGGHHVTRHTADFRLNRRRPPQVQLNRKIPLDEGTCDYLAAVLLGTPDIYGWHRAAVPSHTPRRRHLDAPWTMAHFTGGRSSDPHTDGSIWGSALWAARCAVERRGHDPQTFDAVVVRALDRIGRSATELPRGLACRHRRRFATALAAILEEDEAAGGRLSGTVEPVLAARGIELGASNGELQLRCRSRAWTRGAAG